MRRVPALILGVGLVALALAALALWHGTARERPAAVIAAAPAGWVDEASCQGCHATQYGAWLKSHHRLAMQPASELTALGDFDQAVLRSDRDTSEFLRRDGGLWIRAAGADGQVAEFPVAYTFGVEPLQQYLLAMPDGRLQAHAAAWDVEAGRWYHLYDGEGVDHRHPLHWSGPQQNADFMCIECHATGFQRGYDPDTGRFASHWQAPGVGCQSCHGPAAEHLRWAAGKGGPDDAGKGFTLALAEAGDRRQVEMCARCHSRRTPLGNGYQHGNALLDDYLPMTLDAGLYQVDGKIDGEVFEYGSFLQSRMYAAGVVCSDCHEPHGGRLRGSGNGVCVQCHNPAGQAVRADIAAAGLQAKDYDQPSHHHHAPGSAGARCTACHMPGKVYMGKDLRHDHSFSSPHPAQARELGHSDACLDCHRDSDPERVLAQFRQWYPQAAPRDGGYARALHAARRGLPGAAEGLLAQLARGDLPAIRRATLLGALPDYPSADALRTLVAALSDDSPLVRRAAVEALAGWLPASRQAALFGPLLRDPVRAVRLAAAWQLLSLEMEPSARRQVIAEYEQVQLTMLDRAEALLNLASVYAATGRDEQVEPTLRRALQRDPHFFPALIMLAQWREQAAGDADGALRLLNEAIREHPAEASLRHALGLALVRQGLREQALAVLRRAHELAPEQPQYGYVLAVALHDGGRRGEAVELLRGLLRAQPADRRLRQTLIAYLREGGEEVEAQALWAGLAELNPGDPLLPQREHGEKH